MPFPSVNFLSLHGRLFGLFRGLGSAGDVWLSGDGFQGVLSGTNTGITARAGGGQTNATLLTARNNVLSTVASGADSVKLPVSQTGMEIVIINDGAAAAQVFGSGTDTIDGVATATGVALTNARRSVFICTLGAVGATPGTWVSYGAAKST